MISVAAAAPARAADEGCSPMVTETDDINVAASLALYQGVAHAQP